LIVTIREPILSASERARTEALLLRLSNELRVDGEDILQRYPISDHVTAFDAIENSRDYQFIPTSVDERCVAIARDHSDAVLETYQRSVLAWLITKCDERADQKKIPGSIRLLLRRDFERILRALEQSPPGFFTFQNELFVKDLALCRLKMLPCGSEVVELSGGVPRSTLLRGGVSQFVRAGWFVTTRLGGFKPLYESHWDRRLARQFTEQEYNLCYLRIAELLELNPDVRGMFGASWWFDPQVRTIAPELEFLRRVPEANGARIFRVGQHEAALRDATTFSRKRRELYERGEYKPERFMLVWAREDLLGWAKRFRVASS
jgi:hypothetical protein